MAAAVCAERSLTRRDSLVTQCYRQLHAFLAIHGIAVPTRKGQAGQAAPSNRSSDNNNTGGPVLCAPAAMKRFLRALAMNGVFDAAADGDVEAQRAAVRAAYIAMPVEICRLLTPGDLTSVDAMLAEELAQQPLVDAMNLPEVVAGSGISVWQGDMSLLVCDAVVNPGNNALLGCFLPSHRCLDNILHAQSGPRLRLACAEMLQNLGIEEDTNGNCRVTPAFGLPSKFVFHTVGPSLVSENHRGPPRAPTALDAAELRQCYRSCLEAAAAHGLQSIAFCCISTGIFGYPQDAAASIAIRTCLEWRHRRHAEMPSSEGVAEGRGAAAAAVSGSGAETPSRQDCPKVIFNVFKDEDLLLYNTLVPTIATAATAAQSKGDADGAAITAMVDEDDGPL